MKSDLTQNEIVPEHGIVTSSRVRLARNIRPYSFPGWLKKQERLELLEKIQQAVLGIPEMQEAFLNETMDHFTPLQKQLLVEQHLISREHAAKNAGSGIVISKDKTLSFMLNEEDHLRLQSIRIGFDLTEAWKTIDRVDTELENNLEFAFSANIGYLTACPTNVGTGMRASVMLHLPGLVLSDQINQVIKSVNQIGLAVRGLYGEGTEALGNLFQISNQMTLGESEKQIIDKLTKVINQIVEHEKNARQKLVQEKSRMLADQLGRAFGVLNFAHSISSKEALNLLSLIRLGIEIGVFPQSYRHKVDALFIDTQPAHLQHASKKKLSADERDSFRADLLRERLKSMPDPSMKHLQL